MSGYVKFHNSFIHKPDKLM